MFRKIALVSLGLFLMIVLLPGISLAASSIVASTPETTLTSVIPVNAEPAMRIEVATGGATNITDTTATLNGVLTGWSEKPIRLSFEWGNTTGYGNEAVVLQPTPTFVPHPASPIIRSNFSAVIKGLTPGKTYFYRARAIIEGKTYYGEEKIFTPPLLTRLAVITHECRDIAAESALLIGELINRGSNTLVKVYFEWGMDTRYGNKTEIHEVSRVGSFKLELTGLKPETTYHYRAAAAGDETVKGEDKTFTTLSPTRIDEIEGGLPPEMVWERTFGGAGDDGGYAVITADDGGYVIAGYTGSQGAGGKDAWLIKTDSQGQKLWDYTFGGAGDDVIHSIIRTANNDYVLAGYTGSGATGMDYSLIKTDSRGRSYWERIYDNTDHDLGRSVIATGDGGYLIAGQTSGGADGHTWLVKTDSHGDWQWDKVCSGLVDIDAMSIIQTEDGGCVYTCAVRSANGSNLWLEKRDLSGTPVWFKVFGLPPGSNSYGCSVSQTPDGGYIIAGTTDFYEQGNNDVWLIKTDSDGNKQWDKVFRDRGDDIGRSVICVDGGYVVTGKAGHDAFLLGVDTQGNKLWGKIFEGAEGNSVIQSGDGGYIITGKKGDKVWLAKIGGEKDGDGYGFPFAAGLAEEKPVIPPEKVAKPGVLTGEPGGITVSSAILTGNLISLGESSEIRVSFEWGVASRKYQYQTDFLTVISKGGFNYHLSGISPGTKYYFRARAEDFKNGITVYGAEKYFTTRSSIQPQPLVPEVDGATVIITNKLIADTSVEVNANNVIQNRVELKTRDEKARLVIGEKTRVQDDKGQAPGAFTVNILILPAGPSTDEAVIQAYEFGPPETLFEPPVTLTLQYDREMLPAGAKETDLTLAIWAGARWVPIGSEIDTPAKRISAKISGFGRYAVLASVPATRSANFIYYTMDISPAQVKQGKTVTIRVGASNTGYSQGKCTLVLKINDIEMEARSLQMDAGEDRIIEFEFTPDASGEHDVDINGLTGSFTVIPAVTEAAASLKALREAPADTGDSSSSPDAGLSQLKTRVTFPVFWIIVIALVVAGLAAALVSVLRRTK